MCCIFIKTDCGGTINYNNTYIQNSNYPSAQTSSESCTWRVNKESYDICFIRLDFDRFQIEGPDINSTPQNECVDTFMTT